MQQTNCDRNKNDKKHKHKKCCGGWTLDNGHVGYLREHRIYKTFSSGASKFFYTPPAYLDAPPSTALAGR